MFPLAGCDENTENEPFNQQETRQNCPTGIGKKKAWQFPSIYSEPLHFGLKFFFNQRRIEKILKASVAPFPLLIILCYILLVLSGSNLYASPFKGKINVEHFITSASRCGENLRIFRDATD
jgi:hypothetical protein